MVYVVLCLIVFGCQYQCNWLPGKTHLWNDLLRVIEWDVKSYTLSHSLILFVAYYYVVLAAFVYCTAYTTFYILGLLCSMQVPFVGMQPIRTSEHMASAGNVGLYFPNRYDQLVITEMLTVHCLVCMQCGIRWVIFRFALLHGEFLLTVLKDFMIGRTRQGWRRFQTLNGYVLAHLII